MLSNLSVSDIAKFLKKPFIGSNFVISEFTSLDMVKDNCLTFANKRCFKIDNNLRCLIIAIDDFDICSNPHATFILSKKPRLDFIRVLNEFFQKKRVFGVDDSVKIGYNCKFGKNLSIGYNSAIKDNVVIGSNVIIEENVVIEANTVIGDNCYIKAGALIGGAGFGFERDEKGVPIRFPHFGNVIIGNNVEIGANTVIARATLNSTVIKDNVKIDDCVFIAHNVTIEKNVCIVAMSEISGSVKIGKNCWIGPNVTIRDGASIGDNSFLGAGVCILKDVEANKTLASISNLSMRDVARLNKTIQLGKKYVK